MTRRFTGWHMATILIAFFGIVIGVNLVMARFAISSFGGTVVDNSYVASQNYNEWLDAAEAQRALGWSVKVRLDPTRHVLATASKSAMPIAGLAVSGIATHPLGQAASIPLSFTATDVRSFHATAALPPGRWKVTLVVRSGTSTMKVIETVR